MLQQLASPSRASNSLEADTPLQSDATIRHGKEVIKSLNDLLDCHCMRDGYCLTIVALVVLRLLESYATLIGRSTLNRQTMSPLVHSRAPPSPRTQSAASIMLPAQLFEYRSTVHDPALDMIDSQRATAKSVLAELHGVRQLIERVFVMVRTINDEKRTSHENTAGSGGFGDDLSLALSSTTFQQMEADVRARLKSVLSSTLEQLKRL
jgi:hypothetical protein